MANQGTKNALPGMVDALPRVPQRPEKATTFFPVNLKLSLLLTVVSFAVYANTLKNGYVLDDTSVITENKIVNRGISAIPEILLTPYHHGFSDLPNDNYRPLSLVMFAVEHQLWGNEATAGHFINIIVFSFCVVVFFLFLDQLFEKKKTEIAFLAALLFALHPIHTEVVANIKSRDELLCFSFAFLGLLAFTKYLQTARPLQLLMGSFFFLTSLLSKETTITFLAVIPIVFFFYLNDNKRRSVYIMLSTIAAAIIFLAARYSVLHFYHASDIANNDFVENELSKQGLAYGSRLATAILLLGYYIKLLVAPYLLICDYSYNSIPFARFSDPIVWAVVMAYAFLAVFSIRRLLKNKKDPYAFAILFFLITISLFSNLLFLTGTTLGERLLFIPSAGFCVLLALIIVKYFGETATTVQGVLTRPKIFAVLTAISLTYTIIAVGRNREWKDNYTLFSADILKSPNNCRLYFFLGSELEKKTDEVKDPVIQKQNLSEEIDLFSKSLAINPDFSEAHLSIGRAFIHNMQFDSAEVHIKRALELSRESIEAMNYLAQLYITQKKYPEVIALCTQSVQLNPNDENTQIILGNAYYSVSQYDSAEIHVTRALALSPGNAIAIKNLATIFYAERKYVQAIGLYKKAIELNPNYVNSYANIGGCYQGLRQFDSAVYYLNKAILIDPWYNRAYENLAITYQSMGQVDSAKKYEAFAQKKNPLFKL